VLGVDETGLRVSKRQDWVHVSSTEDLTLLAHDRRRGERATTGIDILPRFEGVVVHDGFSSYDQCRQCRHAQCNAHILRELNYVIETSEAAWAQEMKALLLEIKAAVDEERRSGGKKLPPREKKEFLRKYDESIEKAKKQYGQLQKRGLMRGGGRRNHRSRLRAGSWP
jgi:transposase